MVRLFDPAAHAELSRLSRRSEQPVTARVPEHGPDTASQATAEAKRLVANAQESARRILAEAASDADDIKNAARAEAKALQAQAAKPGTGVRASGPTNFVSRESRDKLDRVQRRVRQLKDEDSKAQSELNSTRRQIMALRKRADAIKKEAQETRLSAQAEATAKAEQILRSARAEAEAIRLESRQSEAYQTLRRSALAQGERDAAALLEEARKEAEALMAKARKDANIVTREASAKRRSRQETGRGEDGEESAATPKQRSRPTTAETRLTLDQAERTEKAPGDASESATPAARTGRADGPTAANQLRRRPDLNQASQRNFRQRFKPARSGNGHIRSLNVDGWRLNLWVGMTNGLPRASAFAPSKTVNGRRVEARDAPLMESACAAAKRRPSNGCARGKRVASSAAKHVLPSVSSRGKKPTTSLTPGAMRSTTTSRSEPRRRGQVHGLRVADAASGNAHGSFGYLDCACPGLRRAAGDPSRQGNLGAQPGAGAGPELRSPPSTHSGSGTTGC